MLKAGRRHLVETGMGYGAHLGRAWRIGAQLTVAGFACLAHGLFPGVFKDKASKTILRLHEEVKGPAHAGDRMLLEFEI